MRYSQLRAFHNVAIHGGFSRAAEALGLTQPAISEQVRKLEQEHDVLLFNRDRKQVRLTPAGEDLLFRTKQLFEVEQRIAEFLSEGRASLEGRLRIIADSAHHVTRPLEAFRSRYPEVFVTLRTGNTEQVLTALRNYDAEIGVVGSLDPGPDMASHDLGMSSIIAFAARSFLDNPGPRSVAELARLPLVFREQGSRTRQKLEQEAGRQGITLHPVAEVEGREAMREVVASGAGIGFVSKAEFGNDDRLIRIEIKDANLSMSETLVYLQQRRDLRIIRAFLEVFPKLAIRGTPRHQVLQTSARPNPASPKHSRR